MKKSTRFLWPFIFVMSLLVLTACSGGDSGGGGETKTIIKTTGITPQQMSDALYTVIKADRTVYARLILNRLVNEEQVIQVSEHWRDNKALLLPVQMLRASAEIVQESGSDFSFSLLSLWPINEQNKPKTDLETKGLEFIRDNPDKNFYGEEKSGNLTYFTGVYPDNAVSQACVACHNGHKDSPKKDFELNDNMGGIVIRIPIKG